MGFDGEIVIGRGEPARAPLFAGAGGAVTAGDVRPGGWRTLWCRSGALAADPPGVLRDTVLWTGAPACVVSVYGAGYALARGLAPAGGWWEAWLNPRAAAAKLAEVPDDVDDVSVWARTPGFAAAVGRKLAALDAGVPLDARGALAWARTAGFGRDVQPARVEAVLRARAARAEHLIPALLDALGFPPALPAESARRPTTAAAVR